MRITFVLFFTLTFIGCSSLKRENEILPKDDFINILVDLHMLDAYTTDYSTKKMTGVIDSLTVYTSLFEKYNTNKKVFDSTLSWYTLHPKKLSEVYDEVFGKINRINQDLKDKSSLFKNNKSEIVWQRSKNIYTRGDTASYPKPFIVPINISGTYLIEIRFRMHEDDKSINPKVGLYTYTMEKDSSITEHHTLSEFLILKSNNSRNYQSVHDIKHENNKFLKIAIPVINNKVDSFYKNLQLSSVKVLRLKVEAEKEGEKE